jgi:hypothetical protein
MSIDNHLDSFLEVSMYEEVFDILESIQEEQNLQDMMDQEEENYV